MAPEFPLYSEETAKGLTAAMDAQKGLPGFLGARVAEIGPGRLAVTAPVREDLLNPFGSLHGGVIAALVDHVLGAVLYPVIEPGHWAATTEFKLNYLAPVREGEVRAESEIISMTKRTAVVRIEVTNDGRAVCAAQGTVLIQAPKK